MISVIVPIYNVAQYLLTCLVSIQEQIYQDLEVLLVDDCGSDSSMQIAEDFVESHRGDIKYRILHHERNKGLSEARNTALREAKGEYVFFLDSDDEITPDCLSLLHETAEKYPQAQMVIGDYDAIGGAKPNTELRLNTGVYNKDILHHYIDGDFYVPVWNKLIRRDFIEQYRLNFVPGLIHEDNVWSFRAACHLSCIAVVNRVTLHYYIRQNSIVTATKREKRRWHQSQGLILNAKYLFEHNIPQTKHLVKYMENDRHWLFCFFMKNGSEEVAARMYKEMRKISYWSPWKLLKMGLGKWLVLRALHQYLPSSVGMKYYLKML